MAAALVKKTLHSAVLFAILLFASTVNAGSIEGPYVIWVNLSKEKVAIDSIVKKFLDSGDTTCWNGSAIMFMRSKPKILTEQLVQQALIENNPSAQRKVQRILTMGFGDAEDGFDGIIAYIDYPKKSMFSMSRNKRKVEHDLKIESADQIPSALCNVMPDIRRTP